MDIESVERIEVVKGPGSSLWGTNALLAVINVITRKGSDIDGVRIVGEIGSHQRGKGFVELGKEFENGLDIAVSIAALDSDGRKHIYFREYDDPSTNNGVATGIDGTEAMRGYLSASYEGFRFLFVKGTREKDVPTAYYETVFNAPGTVYEQDTMFTELSYERDVFENVNGHLFLRAYHDWVEELGDYVYDYDYGVPPLPVNRDIGESKSCGAEARFSMEPISRVNITTGVEFFDAYDMNMRNYDADPWYWKYLDIDGSYDIFSLYVQADIRLLEQLRLVAGGRFDDYSTFGDHTSPRAALIYTPLESSTFKLLYGEAFRAPDFYELKYELRDWYLSNPDLEPEEIETWELVWEQKVGDHTRIVADVFHFTMHDLIENVEVTPGITQFQNKTTVKSRGAELMVESRLDNGVTGYMGFTVTETIDEDGHDRVSNSPDFTADGGISIPVCDKKLYVTPEVIFVDERKTLGGGRTGSMFLTNLVVSTGEFLGPFDVSLGVYNVFDERYSLPGAGTNTHFQDTIRQDGRTFRLQLSCEF